jgi:molybdopterin molybdotransferase
MKEEVAREGDRVLLPTAIAAGQHVARRGSECAAGATVLEPGSRLSPLAIAVLASFGRQRVLAIPAPSLAVITTGDELVATGSVPGSAQIRNSNGPMLIAQARRAGLGETLALHALDTAGSLAEALAAAADRDLVVLSGGVSAGGRDLVPRALEDAGAEIVLHRVKQKPGKPLLFAVRRRPSGNQLLFGLPGNPLSTHFCFHRYVLPAARKLMGRPPPHEAARARATLGEPLVARADRTLFLPLALARSDGGALAARALVGQGSADIFASWRAEAYLRLEPGEHRLEAGRELECELIGEP